jgi:hypothetical protein
MTAEDEDFMGYLRGRTATLSVHYQEWCGKDNRNNRKDALPKKSAGDR